MKGFCDKNLYKNCKYLLFLGTCVKSILFVTKLEYHKCNRDIYNNEANLSGTGQIFRFRQDFHLH